MNIARLFRWIPIAFGRKASASLAEMRRNFGTGTENAKGEPLAAPKVTQAADPKKLKLKPSLTVVGGRSASGRRAR